MKFAISKANRDAIRILAQDNVSCCKQKAVIRMCPLEYCLGSCQMSLRSSLLDFLDLATPVSRPSIVTRDVFIRISGISDNREQNMG